MIAFETARKLREKGHEINSLILIDAGAHASRKRWPVPVIASAYGWWDGPIGRRRLHQRIERDFALPHFDRVITVSKNMQHRVLEGRTSPDRVRVVPTGLMPQNSEISMTFRKHFNIPDTAIVVGTLGRVSAEKGHRYLLDAVHALRDECPDLYCAIVGTGPALNALKLQSAKLGLESRVVFTGFWEDRGDALNAFDLFALPSTQREGLPTSVLEAQQAGLPVIASDIGGTAETIHAGRTGILVTPANVSTLSAAIRALVSDAEGREAMGKAARAWVAERFSMRTMIENISSVYQEAIHEFENARSH